MSSGYWYDSTDQIECPNCGEDVDIRMDICPHCEDSLC